MKTNTYFKIENENQLISLLDDHKTDFYVQDFDQLHKHYTDGYHYAVKDNTGKIRLATHKIGVEIDNPYQEKPNEVYEKNANDVKSLIELCGYDTDIQAIDVVLKAMFIVAHDMTSISEISKFVKQHKK